MKFASFVLAATLVATNLFAATETLTFTSKTTITPEVTKALEKALPGAKVTVDTAKNTLTVTGAKSADAVKQAASTHGLTAATMTEAAPAVAAPATPAKK